MGLLDGELAAIIGDAFGDADIFLDATLTVDGPTTGPNYDPTPGTPTVYPCKAIVENYSDYFRKNALVEESDRKVMILATSLAVKPVEGNRITVSGLTLTVVTVATDPATAVWEVQGR